MEYQADVIKDLLASAYLLANDAHECCYENLDTGLPEDKSGALSYAAACTAKYSAAEAIYTCSPDLYDDRLPKVFNQFDIVMEEIRKVYRGIGSRTNLLMQFGYLKAMFEKEDCSF